MAGMRRCQRGFANTAFRRTADNTGTGTGNRITAFRFIERHTVAYGKDQELKRRGFVPCNREGAGCAHHTGASKRRRTWTNAARCGYRNSGGSQPMPDVSRSATAPRSAFFSFSQAGAGGVPLASRNAARICGLLIRLK